MRENKDDIELIDLYLEKKLDTESIERVENRSSTDVEFRKLVEAQRLIVSEIKTSAFKNDVEVYLKSKKSRFINPWLLSGIAASISILLAVFLTPSDSNSFEKYFEPYPDLISNRDVVNNGNAMYYYGNMQYELAITAFEEKSKLSDFEKLYLGISYLAADQLSKAQKTFLQLQQTEREPYARWYLALCYLKSKEKEAAIQQLRLIQPEDYKYQEASKLLDELSN